MESFFQHNLAKFNGKCSPDEADQWLCGMERIYNAKRCLEENILAFSKYLLSGEASHYWSSTRSLLENNDVQISWEVFKKKFYAKYFLGSVRFAREMEFLQLVQGNMTILEYVDRFKHLIRFHTLAMDEEWQCRKFENGLRGDIKLMVASLCIKEFPMLVERAKVLVKIKKGVESYQSQPLRVGGPTMSRGSFSSWKTPYSRPSSSGSSGSSSHSSVQQSQTTHFGGVKCHGCGELQFDLRLLLIN